jgi:hypothetical protein
MVILRFNIVSAKLTINTVKTVPENKIDEKRREQENSSPLAEPGF